MQSVTSAGQTAVKRIKSYVLLTIAAVIYSASVSMLLDPNDIAPGGITGVSVLISRFVPIPTGTLNLLFNIPIMALGLWKFGLRFILSTFYELVLISIFTNLFASYGALTQDLLIAAVLGGALLAVAIAMTFKAGGTTGGSDIIVKIMRLRWQHIKTGMLFLCFDAMVVLTSWAVFGDLTRAFYSGVTVAVDTIVIDYVLYGPDEAKLIYIITDDPERIRQRFLRELDISATIMQATGAYTMDQRRIILSVMRKQVAPRAVEIVKEEDPTAFMIVSSASEIFGEGYKDITKPLT